MEHQNFMLAAIHEALQFRQTKTGGPFGAVIVKSQKIIATGRNLVTEINDPTAHAEVIAIRNACQNLKTFSLEGCILYTSCEPCPMCLAATYWARISHVYFAADRKDAANIGFDDDFIYNEIPKQLKDRQIPFTKLKLTENLEPFQAWQAWEQHKHY